MHNASQLHSLEKIGISYWIDKTSFFPLVITHPVIFASCFVVVLSPPLKEGTEAYKILTGMLKVLALPADEYCIGWISPNLVKSEYTDMSGIFRVFNMLKPKQVLILGKRLGDSLFASLSMGNKNKPFDFGLEITYHPDELIEKPEYKREAYRELLCLKEVLTTRP